MKIVISKHKVTGRSTVSFGEKRQTRLYSFVTKASMERVKRLVANADVTYESDLFYTKEIYR